MNAETKLLFCLLVMTAMLATAVDCMAQAEVSPVADADRAFDAGRHDEALALYDKVLKDDPANLHALVRSGMLLSWKGQYTAAIERYDRALAVNPDNYKAQMERAKVLSWSRRFDEAEEAFFAIAEKNPDDRDAQLGLARVYSWGGNQGRARDEYMKLVEKNASDADALLGVAQSYAWSGDSATARVWYEKALAAEPGKQGALMGRAYIDLWAGDRARAVAAVEDLERRFPGNSDVAALRRTVDNAMSFWFRATYDSIEDTDDNNLDTTRVEIGDSLSPRIDYRLGLRRSDMTSLNGQDATTDRAGGSLIFLPGGGHRIEVAAGVDQTEDTSGESESEAIGAAIWTWGESRRTSGHIGVARETMVYSTKIADNRIGYDGVNASLTHDFTSTISVELRASAWSLTDDNERSGYDGALRWAPRTKKVTWLLGLGYRDFSYDYDFDNGYFDPQDYSTYFALFGARGPFGRSRATWDLSGEYGRQSFTLGGIDTDDDQTLSGILTLGFPLGNWAVFEVYAAHSDSAMQTATGFESDQYGARLRIQRRQ